MTFAYAPQFRRPRPDPLVAACLALIFACTAGAFALALADAVGVAALVWGA